MRAIFSSTVGCFLLKCFELGAACFFPLTQCRTAESFRTPNSSGMEELHPIKSVSLDVETRDFCSDGNRLLVLEGSGTRIVAYDWEFNAIETLPLTVRLSSPRGIYADRFYIYIYDDQTIYRLSKESRLLQPFVNNIRAAGMVQYAPGELLISDEERKLVWLKTFFGESRVFLNRSDVSRPRGLTIISDGTYALLADTWRLIIFNRAGIVISRFNLPARVDLLTADHHNNRLLLMRRGGNTLFLVSNRPNVYLLQNIINPVQILCSFDRLYVLDNYRRMVVYPLPGQ